MNTYKVIALNVSGRGSKIHWLDEEVNELNFAPGVAEQLVAKGFLERIEPVKPEPPKKTTAAPKKPAATKKPAAPKK